MIEDQAIEEQQALAQACDEAATVIADTLDRSALVLVCSREIAEERLVFDTSVGTADWRPRMYEAALGHLTRFAVAEATMRARKCPCEVCQAALQRVEQVNAILNGAGDGPIESPLN